MQINSSSLRVFREDFAQAVKSLEEKHDVVISMGRIGYSDTSFNAKIEVKNIGDNGEAVADKNFPMYAQLMDVDPTWLNKTFMGHDGKILKFIGLNARRPKNPVEVIVVQSGAKMKCSVEYLKRYMKVV